MRASASAAIELVEVELGVIEVVLREDGHGRATLHWLMPSLMRSTSLTPGA